MSDDSTQAPIVELQPPSADAWIPPDSIDQNPENPRLIFKQKDLDALKQSIYEVGILQPLIVYPSPSARDRYVLIDGERRWRSARELNLQRVPVHIHKEPTPVQNITAMFNIHKLRVDWELMPTALSLQKLSRLTGKNRAVDLSRMTGLGPSMVRKCQQLLTFSDRHQQMVLSHKVKDNLLLETYPVIRAMERNLPELLESRGRDQVVDSIIKKEKSGALQSVTDLRALLKVVEATRRGAPKHSIARIVESVLDQPSTTFDAAYSRVRSLYDVQHLAAEFVRLADEIAGFNPRDVDDAQRRQLAEGLQRLKRELHKLEMKLGK